MLHHIGQFFFALPMHGLEQLYSRFGDSASLVGPVYKREKETSAELDGYSASTAATPNSAARQPSPLNPGKGEAVEREMIHEQGLECHHPSQSRQSEVLDSSDEIAQTQKSDANLEKTMQKLTLVPPSMRFGRGKGNRFTAQQRPKAANAVRAPLSSLPNGDSASPA